MNFSASTYAAILSKLRNLSSDADITSEIKKIINEHLVVASTSSIFYFKSLEEAKAAVATAKEYGSEGSVYYFGAKVLVDENEVATWYTIQRPGVLVQDGAGSDADSSNAVTILVDDVVYIVANTSEPEATGEEGTYALNII